MDLSKDDVLKIIKIIEESGYDDVRVEIGDFKLHLQKHAGTASMLGGHLSGQWENARNPVPQTVQGTGRAAPTVSPAAPGTAGEEPIPEGVVVVRAPMLGTFFRAPSPGEPPFVEVGGKVAPDDTVCLVEVMKLFNSIKAGVAGTVLKFLVENANMVEHGQPLILIAPDPVEIQ